MVETKHIEGEHITANIQQHSLHRVKRFLKMESWGQENTSYCTMAHIYLYFNMYLCSNCVGSVRLFILPPKCWHCGFMSIKLPTQI